MEGAEGLAAAYQPEALWQARITCGAVLLGALHEIAGFGESLGVRGAELCRDVGLALPTLQRLLADPASLPQAVARGLQVVAPLAGLRARRGDDGTAQRLRSLKDLARSSLKALAALSRTAEAAPLARAFERLLALMAASYEDAKRREGSLDFTDLLVKARDLLRDHPDERERARARFSVILVDEFQDTNPLQAEILAPLSRAERATFLALAHKALGLG